MREFIIAIIIVVGIYVIGNLCFTNEVEVIKTSPAPVQGKPEMIKFYEIYIPESQTEDTAVDTAVSLIKRFEGFRSKRYLCPAGIKTIGYGTTNCSMVSVTKKFATKLLMRDVKKIESDISKSGLVLSSGQKAAVISFVYNMGIGRFNRSTFKKCLVLKDYKKAEAELLKWVYASVRGKKKILKGLQRRRNAELKVFRS